MSILVFVLNAESKTQNTVLNTFINFGKMKKKNEIKAKQNKKPQKTKNAHCSNWLDSLFFLNAKLD